MRPLEYSLIAVTMICLVAALVMAVVMTRSTTALKRAQADRDRAVLAEAATMRVLRMSVSDLRADAMRLLGYAERLVVPDHHLSSDMAGILAMTRQIFDHSDDMQDYAVPSAASRRLEPQTLPLRPLIEDIIGSVAATLGPSIRHWRLEPGLDHVTLFADRRALTHILSRALSNAARHSRHNDSVDISVERWPAGLAVIIEDEGAGLLANRRAQEPVDRERRGVGLGLVLARVLMEAHGGQLAIESTARVGTKVTLRFPASRIWIATDAEVVRLAA